MKHYLYKITNIETNQYYVGVRSHKNPEIDKYMGSSSVWTKTWIKENYNILKKEVLDSTFITRELAGVAEVELLKSCEFDELCINCLFAKIPSHLGKKQSQEWIQKRILIGERNGMYGKHHTDETKEILSKKLLGREISKEAREKIGNFHRGKIVSDETKLKVSNTRKERIKSGDIKKTYKPVIVEDLLNNTIEHFDGCKLFAEKYNLNYGSVQTAAYKNKVYLKRYKISYVASISNDSRKLGENGENLEVDNPVGNLGSI